MDIHRRSMNLPNCLDTCRYSNIRQKYMRMCDNYTTNPYQLALYAAITLEKLYIKEGKFFLPDQGYTIVLTYFISSQMHLYCGQSGDIQTILPRYHLDVSNQVHLSRLEHTATATKNTRTSTRTSGQNSVEKRFNDFLEQCDLYYVNMQQPRKSQMENQ